MDRIPGLGQDFAQSIPKAKAKLIVSLKQGRERRVCIEHSHDLTTRNHPWVFPIHFQKSV